jgi:predicted dehydrogenase
MHSQRMNKMREVLDDGKSVGEIRRMTAQFSFNAPPEFFTSNIRSHSSMEPYGCLGDLGWYCTRYFLWVRNWEMPEKVVGRMLAAHEREDSPKPVPKQFSAEFFYKDGSTASYYVSFETENQQWVHVSGTKGYLQCDDFVLPWFGSDVSFETNNAAFEVMGSDFNMNAKLTKHNVAEYSNSFANAQESNLFRNFAAQVLSNELNSDWPEYAMKTQQLLDACYESAMEDKPVTIS